MKKILTAKETAEYLRISYWTLMDKARKGEIPCIRIGKRVVFSMERLDKWMEEQESRNYHGGTTGKQYGVLRKIK